MIILTNDPIELRSGVYKHYKGDLYQVIGYSHNASDDNNVQVLYIGLEISPDKTGPRWATRDWKEFHETVCALHGGVEAYGSLHEDWIRSDETVRCDPNEFVERFTYMGPIYYKGFEEKK